MKAEAHQRIISPFIIFLFSTIACAIMVTGHFNRQGRRIRIASTVVCASACQILIITLINMNNRFSFSIPIAYILLIGVSVFCLYIISTQRKFFN